MTLAQVQAAIAVVTALIITWSALLMATALTLPGATTRAERVLQRAPKKCFFSGVGMALLVGLALLLVNVAPGGLKAIGLLMLLALGLVVTIGAAGLAQRMGRRINKISGRRTSFSALFAGSIVYGFAGLFPLIGWYLFLPISTIYALGAGVLAILPQRRALASKTPPIMPDFDMTEQRI